jgi:aspartyl-tRNA(Asn)/glutamyl-tRNA(Gln) amidotransferase subunit C
MTLTLEQVEHIARLARLNLTDEEKQRFQVQLSAVLDYAASLQEVDTTAVPATTSVLPSEALKTGLRPDEPRPGLTQEDLLKNARQVERGQFRTPPILE